MWGRPDMGRRVGVSPQGRGVCRRGTGRSPRSWTRALVPCVCPRLAYREGVLRCGSEEPDERALAGDQQAFAVIARRRTGLRPAARHPATSLRSDVPQQRCFVQRAVPVRGRRLARELGEDDAAGSWRSSSSRADTQRGERLRGPGTSPGLRGSRPTSLCGLSHTLSGRRSSCSRESCTGGGGAAGTTERGAPRWRDGSPRRCRRVGAVSATLG